MPKNEVDRYIESFPAATQQKLQQLRAIIKAAAPTAQEVISYKMPAYKLNKVLVYFAGYKNHIGFYPTGEGIQAFEHLLGNYKWSKGAVQFALTEPLPVKLIQQMVKYKLKRDKEGATQK